MADTPCSYPGDREAALIGYLYEDGNPIERRTFEVHLAGCEDCRNELQELQGVRSQLVCWAPPEPAALPHVLNGARGPRWMQTLRAVPAWMQLVAALLFLGVAAGISNLDIRYDSSGLSVRTGWRNESARATVAQPRATASEATEAAGRQDNVAAGAAAPWRADLATLRQELRTEFAAGGVADAKGGRAAQDAGSSDAEVIRRVRTLIEASERRQQRELALRIAQVIRDVGAERQADLVKIDRSLGLIQSNTGTEVMKQREMLNYLMRVSQKQ
jgi:hypothetical protein